MPDLDALIARAEWVLTPYGQKYHVVVNDGRSLLCEGGRPARRWIGPYSVLPKPDCCSNCLRLLRKEAADA